ncbi:MAG: hypothetical protein GX455_01745 [Phycisphaerae bacterium]|nr:hypothetical protein [Phycisphaerae bacterium]
MIKFRCGNCNQKLGVPDEWAGKRIRCNRCKESCQVPAPQIELQPVSQTAPVSSSTDLSMPEGELEAGRMSADLLNLEAGTPLPREDQHVPILSKTKIAIPEYRISRGDDDHSRPMMALAKGAGKIPLALICSAVCALIAAGIWAGVSAASGYNFFLLQTGIGWAAGFGIGLLLTDRNMMMGIAAAGIALGGMMVGKVFVANWLLLPEMNKLANDQQAFAREMQKNMDREGLKKLLDDTPELIAMVGLLELAKTGKVAPQTYDFLVRDFFNPTEEESAVDTDTIASQIAEMIDSWDRETVLAKAQEHLPELARMMFLKSKPSIELADAMQMTFNYWDVILVPIGLVWAFRMGHGGES